MKKGNNWITQIMGDVGSLFNHTGCYNLENVAKVKLDYQTQKQYKVLAQICTNLKDCFQKLPWYVSYSATTYSRRFYVFYIQVIWDLVFW